MKKNPKKQPHKTPDGVFWCRAAFNYLCPEFRQPSTTEVENASPYNIHVRQTNYDYSLFYNAGFFILVYFFGSIISFSFLYAIHRFKFKACKTKAFSL